MRHALPLILAAALAGAAFAQDETPVWHLVTSGEETFLGYGVPDTDDGGPSLACKPGSKTVKAAMWVEKRLATDEPTADGTWVDAKGRPAPWPGELTVMGGAARAIFPALVHPEEMYGGSLVAADVPLDSSVVRAIAVSGRIQLEAFGERSDLPPAPRDKIAALLKACD